MEITTMNELMVVGLKIKVKEHELFTKMPKAYDDFFQLINKINDRKNAFTLDITLKREKEMYTQLIGVEVNEMHPLLDSLVGIIIPKAKYLYHQHSGDVYGIYQAFVEMYDYALENDISLDDDEFKIEIHDGVNKNYHLYLRLK